MARDIIQRIRAILLHPAQSVHIHEQVRVPHQGKLSAASTGRSAVSLLVFPLLLSVPNWIASVDGLGSTSISSS
jgi:hypothetical protein